MKDQEKWYLAAGIAVEHIDQRGYEYLNEKHFSMVVCTLEHGLDPAMQSLCLCCPIYGIDFISFIPLLKRRPLCPTKCCSRSKETGSQIRIKQLEV